MKELERFKGVPADDLGWRSERLTFSSPSNYQFVPERHVDNNGLVAVQSEIDKEHALGRVTINDILLSVGVSPHKSWPETSSFTNID